MEPMLLQRSPGAALAPFVERLWLVDERADDREEGRPPRAARERALPTGHMDLVFRLSAAPVRVFGGAEDERGATLGHAVVIGARSSFYERDTTQPSLALGAHFRPGGAAALLGAPAEELAGRHTSLADLWGADAERTRTELGELPSAAARLERLERRLLERLARPPAPLHAAPLHPAVAHALARLERPDAPTIAALARETGYSQRWLIEHFRRAVGLGPKAWARVRRFQRALGLAARARPGGWTRVAAECGYCDQSHLVREFQALAGLAPGAWKPLSAERPSHVPLLPVFRVPAHAVGRSPASTWGDGGPPVPVASPRRSSGQGLRARRAHATEAVRSRTSKSGARSPR
jgi:AraC-like DNA-binding protein